MRVYELFENDSLTEIRMDPSSLAQATKDLDARVGIEFEMVVPGGGTSEDDFEPEPDYDNDRRPRNLGDVLDFFNDGDWNGQSSVNQLEADLQQDYIDWVQEKFDEYWSNNSNEAVEDYIKNNMNMERTGELLGIDAEDREVRRYYGAIGLRRDEFNELVQIVLEDSDLMDEIRDQAQEEYRDYHDIDSWITQEFRRMNDISDNYSSVTWPHWTQYDPSDDDTTQQTADDFSRAVGRPVILSDRYHGGKRDNKSYNIEPDSTIKGDSGELGLEFISPPLPLDEIIKDIEAIKKWAKRIGAYTNESTGLHMNISIPGLTDQNLDYVKLAVLLGDEYVLKQFGRQASHWTVSALKQIQDRVKKIDTTEVAKYLALIKNGLNKHASELLSISGFSKYTSINPKSGYIEFRSPGGDYLNEPTDKLVNTLRRFIVATKSAIDPDADRREYISKLTKLLTSPEQTPTDTIEYFARYSAGELPKSALKSFIKQTQLQRQAQRQQLPPGQKIEWEVSKRSDINHPNRSSLRVLAASEAEAREQATTSGMGWTWLDPDQLIARPAPPQVNTQQLETYTIYDTLDRYNIAGIQARTVEDAIDQFQRRMVRYSTPERYQLIDRNGQVVYPESSANAVNRPGAIFQAPSEQPDANWAIVDDNDDPVLYFTRNTRPEAESFYNAFLSTEPESRRSSYILEPVEPRTPTPSLSSYPSLNLTAPESNPDANYAIIRNSDNAVIEYYTRNTPIEAFRAYSRWLRTMGNDITSLSDIYRYEPVRPRSSSQPQSIQWRILVDGEEVHRFWNRNVQSDANTAARTWILDQIRRNLLRPTEDAEIEVVPVTNN